MFHDNYIHAEQIDYELTLTFEVRTSEDLLRVCSLESLRAASSLSVLRDDAGEPCGYRVRKKLINFCLSEYERSSAHFTKNTSPLS